MLPTDLNAKHHILLNHLQPFPDSVDVSCITFKYRSFQAKYALYDHSHSPINCQYNWQPWLSQRCISWCYQRKVNPPDTSHIYRWSLKLVISVCLQVSYRKTSNISRILVGNKIVDNSDVVELHLHSQLNTWLQWIEGRRLQEDARNI